MTTEHEAWDDDEWVDEAAGPLVRSYTITGGRTHGTKYDLSALVSARAGANPSLLRRLGPEHQRILGLCADRPLALAELSGNLDLPLTTIRVLVDDLREQHLVSVTDSSAEVGRFNRPTLEKILNGLARL